jgi:hypothetical protein
MLRVQDDELYGVFYGTSYGNTSHVTAKPAQSSSSSSTPKPPILTQTVVPPEEREIIVMMLLEQKLDPTEALIRSTYTAQRGLIERANQFPAITPPKPTILRSPSTGIETKDTPPASESDKLRVLTKILKWTPEEIDEAVAYDENPNELAKIRLKRHYKKLQYTDYATLVDAMTGNDDYFDTYRKDFKTKDSYDRAVRAAKDEREAEKAGIAERKRQTKLKSFADYKARLVRADQRCAHECDFSEYFSANPPRSWCCRCGDEVEPHQVFNELKPDIEKYRERHFNKQAGIPQPSLFMSSSTPPSLSSSSMSLTPTNDEAEDVDTDDDDDDNNPSILGGLLSAKKKNT